LEKGNREKAAHKMFVNLTTGVRDEKVCMCVSLCERERERERDEIF